MRGRIPVQLREQAAGRGGNRNLAVQNLMPPHVGAIGGAVAAFILLHYGAVQADARENPLAARIGKERARVESP